MALAACAAVAVRWLLLPRLYDLMLLVALTLQGVGEASGAYDELVWFDRVVHLVVPMLASGVLYVALARLDVLPDPRDDTGVRHLVGIALVTFSLGAAFGAVWELYEWCSDGVFGSALQESNDDTVGDLAMDCLGAARGGRAARALDPARVGLGPPGARHAPRGARLGGHRRQVGVGRRRGHRRVGVRLGHGVGHRHGVGAGRWVWSWALLEHEAEQQREDEGDRAEQRLHHRPGLEGRRLVHLEEAADQPEAGVVDVRQHGRAAGDRDDDERQVGTGQPVASPRRRGR